MGNYKDHCIWGVKMVLSLHSLEESSNTSKPSPRVEVPTKIAVVTAPEPHRRTNRRAPHDLL